MYGQKTLLPACYREINDTTRKVYLKSLLASSLLYTRFRLFRRFCGSSSVFPYFSLFSSNLFNSHDLHNQ